MRGKRYCIFAKRGVSKKDRIRVVDEADTVEEIAFIRGKIYPNGIIWVEGPSDKIYLQSWLDAFTREKESINWGVDCDIVWYGGSNLAHLDAKFWQKADSSSSHCVGIASTSLL